MGKKGQWWQALQLFRDMQQQEIVPDVITYSALISACGRGKQLERALEIFDKMQQQGIEPNIITYSALISACAVSNWHNDAMNIFSEMQKKGVVPKAITCSKLMCSWKEFRLRELDVTAAIESAVQAFLTDCENA